MKDFIITSAIIMQAIAISMPATAAADSWQERVLFSPSPAQLEMEQSRDRVTIFEGMQDVQVARAMDEQFDRIEHMMFVGTVITDERGAAVIDPDTGRAQVEDDGC